MPCACRTWPVGRPLWVTWSVCGFALAGLAGLLYCLPLPYVVTIALSLLWLRRRSLHPGHAVSAGMLHATGRGLWEFEPASSARMRNLRLVRAWLAPAWVTMRFSAGAGPDSKDTMLQVTIWKSSVAPEAWRQLRVRLAGRIARPEPAAARAG